jgi:hypothetical protein
MGRVKLHFAADLYFVHGTAKVGDIGQAVSRGCIRLANEDAIALAALVHDLAGPGLDEAELARLMRESSRTKTLTLDRPRTCTAASGALLPRSSWRPPSSRRAWPRSRSGSEPWL